MKRTKVLVTGAGGFIGHHLVSFLKCHDHWVRGVDLTYPVRFHNIFGPLGTWEGGREKAPAAHGTAGEGSLLGDLRP